MEAIVNPNPCPQCGSGQASPHDPTCPNGVAQ